MNRLCILLTTLLTASFCNVFGQENGLYFSLRQLSDLSWGVYVKTDTSILPSKQTTTGTGQVTIVAPTGFEYTDFTEFAGSWEENARADSPNEAVDKSYISFGFVTDRPKIQFFPNEETLLFTFMVAPEYDGSFYLFENENDPFSPPNSLNSNPGNEISVLDFGTPNAVRVYKYAGNYAGESIKIMANMFFDEDEK